MRNLCSVCVLVVYCVPQTIVYVFSVVNLCWSFFRAYLYVQKFADRNMLWCEFSRSVAYGGVMHWAYIEVLQSLTCLYDALVVLYCCESFLVAFLTLVWEFSEPPNLNCVKVSCGPNFV